MKYYFFPLTITESESPLNRGWDFINSHSDRLIETDVLIEVNTYDKGTSRLLYNNVVYTIKKDYTDLSNKRRIYMGVPSQEGPEVVGDYDEYMKKLS